MVSGVQTATFVTPAVSDGQYHDTELLATLNVAGEVHPFTFTVAAEAAASITATTTQGSKAGGDFISLTVTGLPAVGTKAELDVRLFCI